MTRSSRPPSDATDVAPPGAEPTEVAVPLPPPPVPPPRPSPSAQLPAVPRPASVERVAAKESFSPDEPLPTFTFPVLEEEKKQELLRRVEEAQARPKTSVERVAAKESFAPEEPLPAFTYPVIDDAEKEELLRRVEASRAAPAGAVPAPPGVPPRRPLGPPAEAIPSAAPARRVDVGEVLAEARRAVVDLSTRAAARARRGFEAACAFIDQNRSTLPPRVREPLRQVPAGVILAVLVAGALVMFTGGIVLVRAARGEQEVVTPAPSAVPVVAPVEDPVPREIEQAKKQGHAALEKLAARFPEDHRVWLEVAASHSEKREHAAALKALGRALAADPAAGEHAVASGVLTAAVRKRETMDDAFELLQGKMGSAGAAALYDLSVDPKAALPLRARAEAWVRSEAFEKVAAPDVAIAAALRYARSCSERHALLPDAAEKGERRALEFLNVAKSPTGCGRRARKDCYPCLRKDDALRTAIAAIEKRLGS